MKKGQLQTLANLARRVYVVTNASSEIGFEAVKFLLEKGMRVYALYEHDQIRNKAVVTCQFAIHNGQLIQVRCQLGDMASIRMAANIILEREERVSEIVANGKSEY